MDEPTTAGDLRRLIDEALEQHDKEAAVGAALRAVEGGDIDVLGLYERVLGPLLVDVGSRWKHGLEAVWEEHFTSAVVRTTVEALYPRVQTLHASVPRLDRVAVLACPAQEQHDIGLRMLSDRFEMAGWDAYFLGADLPVEESAAAVRDLDAGLLVLSAATLYHRAALRGYVEELKALIPDVRIVLRGPAFESHEDDAMCAMLLDEAEFFGERDA